MSLDQIIGRQREKEILDRVLNSKEAEFVAIYGRRRVGKTHLIREFFDDAICFEIVGLHGVTLHEQFENFARSLNKAIGLGIQPQKPSSWSEAFQQLEIFLQSLGRREKKCRRVVFLDELPWLNTPRSRFLSSLEHFWNSWASRQRDLILVICGSAASWMLHNIVKAKGGLHNRLTCQIRLLPFTLCETEKFLGSRGVKLTQLQVVELYMTIGGIPHYLKQAEPGMSSSQIVDKACFSPSGLLRDEFEKLYASLFDDYKQHQNIVMALAQKRKGMTRNEILEGTGLKSGGTSSHRLEELEESGFIQAIVPFGKKANDALYRLSDEYSLFYLDWIRKLGKRSPGDGYWLLQQNKPQRNTWSGYAFENLCLKHVQRLKVGLGIEKVETTESPWYFYSPSDSKMPGAQIDLLIDRRDDTINVCEMKYSGSEFIINKNYADILRQKLDVFPRVTGTRKNLFLTMVTTFGVANNPYAKELVANSLTIKDLF